MNVLNKLIVAALPAVPKPFVRKFANRYIAGEEISDAVRVVKLLNGQNLLATLDVLGEDIHDRAEAAAARDKILEVLDVIGNEKLDSNVSIKLTQLGLKLNREFCLENIRVITRRAKELRNFIRIDMEDSSCTDDTIWVYRELRKDYPNTGLVLQGYLRRTMDDARALVAEGLKSFRLCKGIYIEPENIAFKRRDEINKNYVEVLEFMLREQCYVGIATHDNELIDAACALIKKMNLKESEYEFQMLLGVRPELRQRILRDGHRVRIYVPFGKQWYQYSIRRFKENPQIAGYVLKALLRRNGGN
ncbi:MAG TPA: proline dehydrogenase family protein [Bacteroidota bacterium]|jgi:proline dehydrogenase|nr:proline dehydrogenase family protein [Bacteroidota bacterium]